MKLKYLGLLLFSIVLAIFYYFINPLDVNFLPKCPLYSTTGIYCPGCGSQRATHSLLNFNFTGVLQQNLLYLAGVFAFGYYIVIKAVNHYFRKSYYSYLNHAITPKIVLIIVLLFWIFRNIPIYPFNLLAPN